jgi:hypothetical protein
MRFFDVAARSEAKKITMVAGILLWAGYAMAQDPTAVMQDLIRRQYDQMRERDRDHQERRSQEQREKAYDREMCLRAGFRGPDVDQCVRDSALYRRYGPPSGDRITAPTLPDIHCTTIYNGDGTSDTDCF